MKTRTRWCAALAAVLLLLAACGQNGGGSAGSLEENNPPGTALEGVEPEEGKGESPLSRRLEGSFSTPEAAVEHLVYRLRAGDAWGALEACAIESLAEQWDVMPQVEQLGVYLYSYSGAQSSTMDPPEYRLYWQSNKLLLMEERLRQMRTFVLSLCAPEGGPMQLLLRGERLSADQLPGEDYTALWSLAGLEKLELVEIGIPAGLTGEGAVQILEQTARSCGAAEVTERLALYRLGDRYYTSGFQLALYGANWRITRLDAPLQWQNGENFAQPIADPEEFRALVVESAAPGPDRTGQAQPLGKVEQHFASPEEALGHLVRQLAAQDIYGALSACAVDTPAQRYDAARQVERQRFSLFIHSDTRAGGLNPPTETLFVEMNRANRLHGLSTQIKLFTLGIIMSDSPAIQVVIQGAVPVAEAPFSPQEYTGYWDPAALAGLELVETAPPAALRNWEENLNQRAQVLGADELTERAVCYRLNGRYYINGVRLVRYGDSWLVESLQSDALGTVAEGFAIEISGPEEFRQIVGA